MSTATYPALPTQPFRPQLSPPLQEGLRHQGAGRLAEAAVLYQKALAEAPGDPEALLLLGILARQAHRPRQAVELFRAVLRHLPHAAHVHLNLARAWLDLGITPEAEAACRQSLKLDPSSSAAWTCLAAIELRQGHRAEAEAARIRALKLPGGASATAYALGLLFAKEGRHEDALRLYRTGLQQAPRDAQLHFARAASEAELGRKDEAIAAYRRALELKPNFPEALLNLGNLFYDKGNFMGAARCYARAVTLRPKYGKGWCNLGNALSSLERYKAATAAYERSLAIDPATVAARHNLGNALMHERDYTGAEACFRAALEACPEIPEHHNSLGNALLQQLLTADAQACYRRTLELRPDYATGHINLANTFLYQGNRDAMMRHYRRGVELEPENAGGQYNLALSCLRAGHYTEGWQRHEHRWEFKELHQPRRNFRQPQWRGEDLTGRTLLLHAEQGLGDTLQFIRYLPLVASLAGRVILEVQPRLHRLLSGMDGTTQVLSRGETLPDFDLHCPLMSLPMAFGTTVESIPAAVPYLRPIPGSVDAALSRWPRLGNSQENRMRIGITWAGNPSHRADHQRSLPLALFAPLARHSSHIDFYSLQMGPALRELEQPPFPIHDAGSQDKDLADTAALIATVDLVISVDTSLAHLSGALGKPVWILLQHLSDWRWLEARQDSPWYPTARLFRQHTNGDWPSAIADIDRSLEPLTLATTADAETSA